MKNIKLAISCGGTGGHFYPGVSVGCELNSSGGEVLLLLGGKHGEKQAAHAREKGLRAVALPVMPSPSLRHPLTIPKFLYGLLKSRRTALRALREFKADAVLGMGSFAGLPVMMAARRLRLPVFLHDGNAKVGRANRYFSRRAVFLAASFPPVNPEKIRCPWDVTGMPIRRELLTEVSREDAVAKLNRRYGSQLEAGRRTFLIFGGSQGARSINMAFSRALTELAANGKDFQVIHLSGGNDYQVMKSIWSKASFPVLLQPSTDDMLDVYSCADLVIARSGGSSVAEIARFALPSVLIPYPYAAENHQWYNAEYLASAGAARILPNDECDNRAGALAAEFLDDPGKFIPAEPVFSALARPDASSRLLEAIASRLPD